MDEHISQREDVVGSKATDVARSREQDGTVEDSQHHQDAQAAFLANSELNAVTPRQSVWTGGARDAWARDEAERPASPSPRSAEGELQNSSSSSSEWQPSLAIGSIKTDQLGSKEAARRYMLQWDHIWEYNRVHHPRSLHIVEEHRTEARKEYEEICARDHVQDTVPKYESQAFQAERIEARVALLRLTLEEAANGDAQGTEPMRRNIMAALDGYATGALGCSHTYALIYAGHIVDTSCTSYAEFTADRQGRLDRYLAQHGPGYLWWEPPLARAGRDRVSAKKGTVLELVREDDYLYHRYGGGSQFRDDSSHFQISLGFRNDNTLRCRRRPRVQKGQGRVGAKRKWEFIPDTGNSARQPVAKKHARPTTALNVSQTAGASAEGTKSKVPRPPPQTAAARSSPRRLPKNPPAAGIADQKQKDKDKDDEEAGPTVFFDTLLDSGAEIPILLHDDFRLLGFTQKDMNAATVVELNAAAGQSSRALCFELLVGLDLRRHQASARPQRRRRPDNSNNNEDEDEDEDGNPEKEPETKQKQQPTPSFFFFPTRVVKLAPDIKPPRHGGYSADRLSGIWPFLAYYTSTAPGQGALCVGDERIDVLGMHKLPAGLRYDPFRRQSKMTTTAAMMKMKMKKLPTLTLKKKAQQQEHQEEEEVVVGMDRPLPGVLRRVTFEHEVLRGGGEGGSRLIDWDLVVVGGGDREEEEGEGGGSNQAARTRWTLVGADRKVVASWEMDSVSQGHVQGQWRRVAD